MNNVQQYSYPLEIQQYAAYIGIQLPQEQFLLSIAQQGITAHLPKQWQACSTPDGQILYRNTKTKQIQQQHPLDEYYQQKVKKQRQRYYKVAKMVQDGTYNMNDPEQLQQLQQQQNDNIQYQYEEGELLTIPEQKSQEHQLDNSQSLEYFEKPSQQLTNNYNNSLRPQSGQQLLNNGMYIVQSSNLSSLYNNSKDNVLNNFNNSQFSLENLKKNYDLKFVNNQLEAHHQSPKQHLNQKYIKHNSSNNNNKLASALQQAFTPPIYSNTNININKPSIPVTTPKILPKNQQILIKQAYLDKLKKQIDNTVEVKKLKEQLLLQIKRNNQMKLNIIKGKINNTNTRGYIDFQGSIS